ncbi:MAG: hypothetical protein HY819_12885 [Acidobacteria bacterium]|nr:hypothetical protein [Acidobacteriota bacterium]
MKINRLIFFTEKIKQLQHSLTQAKTMDQNIEIVKDAIKCYHILAQYLINNADNDKDDNDKEIVELCKKLQEIENSAVLKCQFFSITGFYKTKSLI